MPFSLQGCLAGCGRVDLTCFGMKKLMCENFAMRPLFCFLLLSVFAPSSRTQAGPAPVFVSTHWLAEHLEDPGVVVLQVGFNRPEFRLGHISGARFLWYDWLAPSTPDASTELPSLSQADSILRMLGVSDSSIVVLCFTGGNITTATRMFMTMDYFGFGGRTCILDGGLEAWKTEKRPLAKGDAVVPRSSLTLHPRQSVVVDADWVKENLRNPSVTIVDARDRRFYDGNGGGILRTGHIAGAISLPFSSFVDSTNRIKDHSAIAKLFSAAGVTTEKRVVVYCHVGQQATVVYAVAKELGFHAALYDGSFQDWNVRGEEYPVEKPASPAQ